jgi:hypothetical protein
MKRETRQAERPKRKRLALKDWRVVQNDLDLSIRQGDDVNEHDLPVGIIQALKTEGVIK